MNNKRIVLVGHCGPDSGYLRMTVSSVQRGIQVVAADEDEELTRQIAEGADLLLINRQLDWGFPEEEGTAVIRRLRARYPHLKMMLVSNYPESQAAAIAAGALPGFGKREIGTPRVTELLKKALTEDSAVAGS